MNPTTLEAGQLLDLVADRHVHSALPAAAQIEQRRSFASAPGSVRSPRVRLSRSTTNRPLSPSAAFGFVRPRSVVRTRDWTAVFEIAAPSSPPGRQPSRTSHVRLRCMHPGVVRSPFLDRLPAVPPRHSRSDYVRVPDSRAHRLTAPSSHGHVSQAVQLHHSGRATRTGQDLYCPYSSCPAAEAGRWSFTTRELTDAGVGS